MALLSLGENRWRMLRRVIKKKTFRFEDARNMSMRDRRHFDWFVASGFISELEDEVYALTERGRAAADLGEYEWEPAAGTPTHPAKKPKKK
jgi:hypothetical protein